VPAPSAPAPVAAPAAPAPVKPMLNISEHPGNCFKAPAGFAPLPGAAKNILGEC
jgi:hypothetical protein